MSLGFFRPVLHVPLSGRVDVASCWGRILGTVSPAPRAARPTVMDWRLKVFFVGHSGLTGAVSFIKSLLTQPCKENIISNVVVDTRKNEVATYCEGISFKTLFDGETYVLLESAMYIQTGM